MWHKEAFLYISHVTGRGFIDVVGHNVKSNCLCVIINVYAACFLCDKVALWDALSTITSSYQNKVWCCCGDFNVVRCVEERKGLEEMLAKRRRSEASMSSLKRIRWWIYQL